jgi:hypothetical protein
MIVIMAEIVSYCNVFAHPLLHNGYDHFNRVICKKAIQAIQNGKKVFSTNKNKLAHTINEAILAQLAPVRAI